MPHPVTCGACHATFLIPDEVWDKRVHGQVATLKCRQCKAPIEVDGRVRRGSAASIATSAAATPLVAHPDPQPAAVARVSPPAEEPHQIAIAPDLGKPPEPKQTEVKVAEAKPVQPAAPSAFSAEPTHPNTGATEFGGFEVTHPDLSQAATRIITSQAAKLSETGPATGTRDIPASAASAKQVEPSPVGGSSSSLSGFGMLSNRKIPERSPTRPALPSNVSVKTVQDSTPKPKPAAPSRAEAKSSPGISDPDKQRGSTDLWVVSFGADDDRELSTSQLRDTLAKGLVTRDTIVWREGMTDWLPIIKIPDLAQYLKREKVAPVPSASGMGPGAAADDSDDETIIYRPGSKVAAATVTTKPNLPAAAMPQMAKWASPVAPKTEPHDASQERSMRATAHLAASSSTGNVTHADPAPDVVSKPDVSQRLAAAAAVTQAAVPAAKAGGGPPPLRRAQPSRPDESAVPAIPWAAASKPLANDDVVTSIPAFVTAQAAAAPPPLPVKDQPESPAGKPAIFPPAVQSPQPFRVAKDLVSQGLRATPSFAPRPSDFAALTKIRPKFPKWLPFAVLGGLVLVVAIMAALSWRGGEDADTADRRASPDNSILPLSSGPLGAPTAVAQAGLQKDNGATSGDLSAGFANKFAQAAAKQRPTARFDKDAAEKALAPGFAKAAGCHNKGEPTGSALVTLSISPSGQVLSVTVGPPFATTFTAECIRSALRESIVPPFQGSPGRLAHSITIH